MQRKWRFLDTGENPGIWNMAVDEAMMIVHEQGLTPPTLRVYQWSLPYLSLGRDQDLETVNLRACKKLGIGVVRRLTGGSSTLHKDELTYSVVLTKEPDCSLKESYEIINKGITEAYKILGVKLGPSFRKHSSPICFLSIGLTDFTYSGKKLIGSVRARKNNVILQHGSLVIKHDPEIIFSVHRFPTKKDRREDLLFFSQTTTSLSEIIGQITPQKIKEALRQGFQDVLGIEFFEGKLTENEALEAEKLLSKYQKLDWPSREAK